jgi:hypothetical protein
MFRVPIGGVTGSNTELFLLMAERGITILPNVVGIVGTDTGNKYPSLEVEPTRANWRGQLEGLLNHYGPEGELWEKHTALAKYAPKYWEIWNEPNVGPSGANGAAKITQAAWAHRYGEILEVAREAFIVADSQAKILFGGALSVGQWDPNAKPKQEPHMTVGAFIRQVGHYGDYDALAVHPYAFTGKKAQSPTSGEVGAVADKVMKNIKIARKAMEDVKMKWVAAIVEAGGTPPAEPRKPIWVTEFGWPVVGHLAIEDEHHRLVGEKVQKELLNASFNRMKGNYGTGKHELDLENLLYYNIQDNNPLPAPGLTKEQREASNKVARRWDNHCGLMESEKGVGQEQGKMREAWSAFVAQAK